MNDELFLDMDGVLVNLHWGLRQWFHMDDFTEKENTQRIDEVLMKRLHIGTHKEFWQSLPQECWANFPKTLECDAFVDLAVELVGQENVFIATTTIKTVACYAGKFEWVCKNLPEWIQEQFITIRPKQLLAKPGRILVDDLTRNCSAFRAASGKTIFVRRPWSNIVL